MTTKKDMAIPLVDPRHQHWATWALDPICAAINDAFEGESHGSPEDLAAIERMPCVHDDGVLRGPRVYVELVLQRLENEGSQLVQGLVLTRGACVADKACDEIEGLVEIIRAALAQ